VPFTIPNEQDAPFIDQSEIDKVDVDILVAALKGDGVLTGCAVAAQGVPDMTVAVASGTVQIAGATVTVAAGNVTITAADPTNRRFDLIVVDSSGVKSAVAGPVAATALLPAIFPSVPADSVVLAAIFIPAADAAIQSNQIIGKQVIISGAPSGAPTTADYLVGSVQGGLSAEIVVGTTPGGELGGTWGAPTVDAVHSGSAHVLAHSGLTGLDAPADDHTQHPLLVGRDPPQDLSGGTLTGQQFILHANAFDATGVLTLDPTTSTLSSSLTLAVATGLLTAGVLGVKTNIIIERTAAAGVTIDTALIKDGSFQIPAGINVGLKDSNGNLVLDISQRSLRAGSGGAIAVLVWSTPVYAAVMAQCPNNAGYSTSAPIGAIHNFNAASLPLGYFGANRGSGTGTAVNNDEGYLRFLVLGAAGIIDFGRLKIVARDVAAGTEDGAFLFQVAKAGALATVLGIEQYGVDVTGTLGVTGLSTLTGGFDSGAASTVNGFLMVGAATAAGTALDVKGTLTVQDSGTFNLTIVPDPDAGTGTIIACGGITKLHFDNSSTQMLMYTDSFDLSGTGTFTLGMTGAIYLTGSDVILIGAVAVPTTLEVTDLLTATAGIKLGAAQSVRDFSGFARVTLNAGAGNAVTLNDSAAVVRVAVKSTPPHIVMTGAMTVSSTLGVITSITSPVIYGSAAQWGTISIDSTSHASKGRLTLGGDGVQLTSNDIYGSDGTLRIRLATSSPQVKFFGNWEVAGDYVGTFGLNPNNAYDVAVQMQLGGGGVSMDIRAGDRTAGDGRYRMGFGLAGTISSAIWELAAGTLTIAGPSGGSPGAAVLIGAIAAPAGTLHLVQASTTGAKPVLILDQADVDEDYIKVIGTSDTSADRALVDAVDFPNIGAIKGYLKINVQDDQATNPIVDGDYYIPFYAVPTV